MGGAKMGFQVENAVRTKLKLIIALISPSGGGKTYSALRVAKGLGGKTLLIDTEHRRSLMYANEFTYQVIHFEEPFSPERYVEAIEAAEAAGAEVIIIDSASHEWIGPGGIMDSLDKMPGTNSYQKWSILTPRHNKFINKILSCKAHLIINLRGKDEYVVELNEKGKQAPKKVGVGAQMRDGLEYECAVSLLIDVEKHTFSVMKDNTHIFENRFDLLTEEDGRKLRAWAESGETVASKQDMADCDLKDAPEKPQEKPSEKPQAQDTVLFNEITQLQTKLKISPKEISLIWQRANENPQTVLNVLKRREKETVA
jgi:hypothetical protein